MDKEPYTIFDIFEQRTILQGERIGGNEEDQKTEEEDKEDNGAIRKAKPLLSSDLLKQLNIDPSIVRELITDIEKVEKGVLKVRDGVYLDEKRLAEYFDLRRENLSSWLRDQSEDKKIKLLQYQKDVYYFIDEIPRFLFEKEIGKSDLTSQLSLRAISNILGIKDGYMRKMVDQWNLSADERMSTNGFLYEVYDFEEIWGAFKDDMDMRYKFLKFIFSRGNRGLNMEEITDWCVKEKCSPLIISGMLDKKIKPLENVAEELNKQIENNRRAIELEEQRRLYKENLENAKNQVEQGYWKKGKFVSGVNRKTGEKQWELAVKDRAVTIKYVVDKFSRQPKENNLEYFFSVKRNLVDNPNFKLIVIELKPPFPEDIE